MYGIMNPNDVKSAIINQDGNLTYLSHQFIPCGFEPKHNEPFYPDHDDSEYFWMTMNLVYKKSFPRYPEPLTDNNPGNESILMRITNSFDFDGMGKQIPI